MTPQSLVTRCSQTGFVTLNVINAPNDSWLGMIDSHIPLCLGLSDSPLMQMTPPVIST